MSAKRSRGLAFSRALVARTCSYVREVCCITESAEQIFLLFVVGISC
jgi:hypothetical protein